MSIDHLSYPPPTPYETSNRAEPGTASNETTSLPNTNSISRKRPKTKERSVSRNASLNTSIEAIGDIELSLLRTLEELRLCTLGAVSRMFYNSPYTARDNVQHMTNLSILSRVQVDSSLVSQSIGYRESFKNPVLALGSVGTIFLRKHFERERAKSQPYPLAPNLSWSHDVAVSEALSYLVAMARATHEISASAATHRATAHLFNERRSAVWKNLQFTLDKRNGINPARSTAKIAHTAVVRPDAAVLWKFSPGWAESPYAVDSDKDHDPRWTPTRHSWEGALSHQRFGLPYMAEVEQDGEGWYRWWLIEYETGNNGAAVMRDKIRRYLTLRAMLTRKQLYGDACPQILIVVRSTAQIQWQRDLWRRHWGALLPGSVLITTLERLHKIHQVGRSALLTDKCFFDPLSSNSGRPLSFVEAMAMSIAIVN